MSGRRDERGLTASVETAVLAPAIILFVALLLTLGRLAITDQQVSGATSAAARAASLERSPASAEAGARSTLESALRQQGVACRNTSVSVDASGVGRRIGQLAAVRVRVRCTISLADISLPLVPGTLEIAAERGSPVDPLRGD